MRIHQLLSGAGPHDAITTEAVSFRSRFREWGWDGKDYAVHVAPGLNGHIRMLKRFKPKAEDILLIHHSAGAPRLRELLALPNRKLLLYHNVTPAPWFWEHAPNVAVQCAVGREQLPVLVRAVDVAAADSHFNAAELQQLGATRTAVVPLLVDYTRLGARKTAEPTGPPTVIFVGRLSPHKHQDEVIRAFSLYRRHRAPDARLVLVGDPISSRYLDFLRSLAESLAPGAVSIESGLTNAELGERYRAAHAFLCLSAHEGFCIPVLEAFSQGVPVIARPAGAIPETTGDAALLVEDPDPAVIAELVHLAVTDVELRAELRRRGEARLALYAPDQVAARLREAVEATTRG
ncbi:MAG TPA: glycosyltransferase [Solirubrobacteraceae bacterium]|jgi:glycosyltransferase involved in cell wall biosynthesis|nr:glycosyltransferase [Solirubrobacteraceae bacterium]